MKSKGWSSRLFFAVIAVTMLGSECLVEAQDAVSPHKGPGNVVVRPKFGGQMGFYDIDQNGTEGVFAEQLTLKNGDTLSAVETFDQATGQIVAVIRKGVTEFDDDVVLGIVGTSTAIVLHEHVISSGVERTYHLISPLDANKYTGLWQPPNFVSRDIFLGLSRDQGATNAAFLFLHDIYPGATNFAFSENMQTQSFGKEIAMTDPDFEPFSEPSFALDINTNTGVLASADGDDFATPHIGQVNLATGAFEAFKGLGSGGPYGLAVDSEDGIACTSTADAHIEFYDLKAKTGFAVLLPGGVGQPQSGFDVEYDPIHKLFLVFQPDGPNEHSFMEIYDPQGNLVDAIDFGPYNHFGGYIALQPKTRSGFLGDGNGLRSFTY
jgi:hypothetical protein